MGPPPPPLGLTRPPLVMREAPEGRASFFKFVITKGRGLLKEPDGRLPRQSRGVATRHQEVGVSSVWPGSASDSWHPGVGLGGWGLGGARICIQNYLSGRGRERHLASRTTCSYSQKPPPGSNEGMCARSQETTTLGQEAGKTSHTPSRPAKPAKHVHNTPLYPAHSLPLHGKAIHLRIALPETSKITERPRDETPPLFTTPAPTAGPDLVPPLLAGSISRQSLLRLSRPPARHSYCATGVPCWTYCCG